MIIKPGAKIEGLTVEILIALMVCDLIYLKYGEECVMTSGKDGVHSENSLHYVGNAIDLRTRFFNVATQKVVTKEIKKRLGKEFDVVLEKDHLHVEFDPK